MLVEFEWVRDDGVILATETVENGVRISYAQVEPPPRLADPRVALRYRYLPDLNWIEVKR